MRTFPGQSSVQAFLAATEGLGPSVHHRPDGFWAVLRLSHDLPETRVRGDGVMLLVDHFGGRGKIEIKRAIRRFQRSARRQAMGMAGRLARAITVLCRVVLQKLLKNSDGHAFPLAGPLKPPLQTG